ncbi:hypothetical protein P3T37_006106 [Kitasatospora sp. MAA4]|uniref:hypothetical protein n=1 Tax=Kitasatospora sp. MAA4 TaxID=3035093 RepID=UPI002475786C|nr:hypothetical protein [Kitasatospora sp. MAA4]MDH6136675.1 hypothetical protein [Kitasatospora sp. MAA4]
MSEAPAFLSNGPQRRPEPRSPYADFALGVVVVLVEGFLFFVGLFMIQLRAWGDSPAARAGTPVPTASRLRGMGDTLDHRGDRRPAGRRRTGSEAPGALDGWVAGVGRAVPDGHARGDK